MKKFFYEDSFQNKNCFHLMCISERKFKETLLLMCIYCVHYFKNYNHGRYLEFHFPLNFILEIFYVSFKIFEGNEREGGRGEKQRISENHLVGAGPVPKSNCD